ncbi:hypothetical protein AB1Y20_002253 [Prymnesium parvum]|uniref:Uncharacterized protein n=1 Tax=Prymnesium parvum TaxID=97485 RepID=A0AB34J9V9_PRYPA
MSSRQLPLIESTTAAPADEGALEERLRLIESSRRDGRASISLVPATHATIARTEMLVTSAPHRPPRPSFILPSAYLSRRSLRRRPFTFLLVGLHCRLVGESLLNELVCDTDTSLNKGAASGLSYSVAQLSSITKVP